MACILSTLSVSLPWRVYHYCYALHCHGARPSTRSLSCCGRSYLREFAAVLACGGLVHHPRFPLPWLQSHVEDPIARLQLLEIWHQVGNACLACQLRATASPSIKMTWTRVHPPHPQAVTVQSLLWLLANFFGGPWLGRCGSARLLPGPSVVSFGHAPFRSCTFWPCLFQVIPLSGHSSFRPCLFQVMPLSGHSSFRSCRFRPPTF